MMKNTKLGRGDGRIKVDPREYEGFRPEPTPKGRTPGGPGWATIMPVPNPIEKEVTYKKKR